MAQDTSSPELRAGLYPALMRHWRHQRGMSQLDLASTAEVSARHISFLETGRARPSAEMVLTLCRAMGVPLRHTNAMLRAAGHDERFDDSDDDLPAPVTDALELMKAHHEPFPLIVVDPTYRVRDLNVGATTVLVSVLGEAAAAAAADMNLARLTFDPDGARPHVVNFDQIGPQLLWRIQREVLDDPDDGALRTLLDELLAIPTVDPDWRSVDLQVPSEPVMVLHLRGPESDLRFVVTVTSFQAPQNVAVERLRIETWFPYDDATAATCRSLAGVPTPSSPASPGSPTSSI